MLLITSVKHQKMPSRPPLFARGFLLFRLLPADPLGIQLLRLDHDIRINFVHMTWLYSELDLPYPDVDKFPTFAAVADYFFHLLDEKYIAGYLKTQIHFALGWQIHPERPLPNASLARTAVYRSPSWSWAKVNTSTDVSQAFSDLDDEEFEQLDPADLISYRVDLVDPSNSFGQLKYAE